MTTRPHPDRPTVLRALTLMTWELPSWKIWSFWNATSWEAGGVASWSPLLQSGASSSLAWGSCSGAGVFAFGASAGQGCHWAGSGLCPLGEAITGLRLRLEVGLGTDWEIVSSAVLVWVWRRLRMGWG